MDEWVIEAVNEYCISKGLFDVNEELIRCKDCKHRRKRVSFGTAFLLCTRDKDSLRVVVESDYCSWGERKENAKTN